MATNETGVMYLERQRLLFANGVATMQLDFTPEMIRDLDVVDQELLTKTLLDFIEKNKVPPGNFVMILPQSVLFVNETPETDPVKVEAQMNEFMSFVPFDETLSKQYQTKNGLRMVAANGGFIDAIRDTFAVRGIGCGGVVPASIFGTDEPGGLSAEMIDTVLKNDELIRGASMVEASVATQQEGSTNTTKPTPSKLPLLFGVFAFLILALIVTIFLVKR